MPLYEYRCAACGKLTEKRQKFSDPEITECPLCGGTLERTITAPAIQFKGGGWYADLYSSGKKAAAGAPNNESGSSTNESGSGTESKGENNNSGKSKGGESSGGDSKSESSKSSDTSGAGAAPAAPASAAPAASVPANSVSSK